MKVLLVDDRKCFVSRVSECLSTKGIESDIATSENKAVKKAMDVEFDVVVLDLRMTDLAGFEMMKKIQEIKPDTEFIIVSGLCDDQLHRKETRRSRDFFLKPEYIESLADKIRQAGIKNEIWI
jgi:DNA-binding NtrC family response regulator